jgi:hypothetical protein
VHQISSIQISSSNLRAFCSLPSKARALKLVAIKKLVATKKLVAIKPYFDNNGYRIDQIWHWQRPLWHNHYGIGWNLPEMTPRSHFLLDNQTGAPHFA